MKITPFYTEAEPNDPAAPYWVGRRTCLLCGVEIMPGKWGLHADYHGITEED